MSGQRCFGIVLRQGFENNRRGYAHQCANAFGEFENRNFLRISDIRRLVLVGHHQAINSFDKIGDVAETARLFSRAVHGDGLSGQRLMNEVRKRASVVQAHARAIRIKDSHDMRVQSLGAMVGHGHGFSKALGFVIHSARSDGIHVAPIAFPVAG